MRQQEIKQETTGSLMKENFITVKMHFTVQEAIKYLREHVQYKSNVHYVYVVDYDDLLVGTISLRELLGAKSSHSVSTIMETNLVTFPADIDQEFAAKIFRDTDLVSIPVVNKDNQLIGLVHVDD